jgi:hypothetical protein
MWCDIPMSVFLASPFSLSQGNNIIARINGANIKGYNASYSNDSTPSITVETVP